MTTTYTVGLEFKPVGRGLKQFESKVARLERQFQAPAFRDPFKGVDRSAQVAGRSVQGAGRAAKAASAGFNALQASIAPLLAAFASLRTAQFVFIKTAELQTQTRSLKVLTGSLEQAKDIIKELQRVGAVTPFTSTELIDTAKRLTAFGVAAENVVDVTKQLADVSGATGAELAGVATAYGQVVAKGRLQGEELLQFQERGVALAEQLKKQYNLTGEEFQKALEKGKISAEAVQFAIQELTDAGGKYADGAIAQSDTLAGKLSTLQDGIEQIARAIGQVLTPYIDAVLTKAINAVNAIQRLLNVATNAGSIQERIPDFRQSARQQAVASTRRQFGIRGPEFTFDAQVSTNPEAQKFYRKVYNDVLNGLVDNALKYGGNFENFPVGVQRSTGSPRPTTPPPLTGGRTGGAGSSTGGSGGGSVQQSNADRLLQTASKNLGLFAGQTEKCADAIAELYKQSGIAIGITEDAWDGLASGGSLASRFFGNDIGQRINRKEDLRPGDLIGFDRTYGSWGRGVQTHVGMYAGNGMMFDHSSRRGLVKRPVDTFAGKFLYGVRPYANSGGDPYTGMVGQNNAMAQEQQRNAQLDTDRLRTAEQQLAVDRARLEVLQAESPLRKAAAEDELRKVQINQQFAGLIEQSRTAEEQAVLLVRRKTALLESELKLQEDVRRIEQAELEIEKQRLRVKEQALTPIREEIGLLQARLNGTEAEYKRAQDIRRLQSGGASFAQASSLVDARDKLKEANSELERGDQLAQSLEQTLAQGVGGAIRGLIDGTKDLNDALADVAQRLGDILLNAALSKLFGGLIPGGLFTGIASNRRASGGNVTAGQPYLVGENGPELFSPGQSGTISNSRAFGELRGTLDTLGQGAPDLSDDMGEPGPVQVDYSGAVLNFNGNEYVSKEDVPRIVDQAVKQSYGYTQNRLRSRPGDRRKLGMN